MMNKFQRQFISDVLSGKARWGQEVCEKRFFRAEDDARLVFSGIQNLKSCRIRVVALPLSYHEE
jgi:hypothetical protein